MWAGDVREKMKLIRKKHANKNAESHHRSKKAKKIEKPRQIVRTIARQKTPQTAPRFNFCCRMSGGDMIAV